MITSYLFTVVLSAFLLFLVQPLIGKVVLPWFGGSAAVWTTVLFFFQVVLMLGYMYSFLLTTYFNRRKQIYIHLGLILCSLVSLYWGLLSDGQPLLPSDHLKPTPSTGPIISILIILGSSIGLPYFALSTTGPLLQSWYSNVMPDRSPYWMYALSNAGSFLALLLYPFVIEPTYQINLQAWGWCLAYNLFCIFVGYIVWRAKMVISDSDFPLESRIKRNNRDRVKEQRSKKRSTTGTIWKMSTLSDEEREYVDRVLKSVQWLMISMCSSILLAAVTNQITQDVAPIPLLWILPLAIYLLSFILTFAMKKSILRISLPLFAVATLGVVFGLSQGNTLAVPLQVSIFVFALLWACIALHTELARLQPEPKYLTAYYFIMAMGSVLGTVIVSVVAPLVFDGYWEFHLGFIISWVILLGVVYLDRDSFLHKKGRTLALYALLLAPATLLLFTGQYISTFRLTSVTTNRNFYGTLRLQEINNLGEWEPFYVLSHGTTIHGMQFKPSDLRDKPTSYFSESSGVGRLLSGINENAQGRKIGVLGLGVGTLAAYGREQDLYKFYEINPEVVDLAEGREGYLNYLSNADAEIDIVLGDARLSLEKELYDGDRQAYDVLVLDVFSGDAIPVHLLTEECFSLYLTHLAQDGVIAAHTSTSHINLVPLLAKMTERFSLQSVIILDDAIGLPCCQSRWVLMSRSDKWLEISQITEVGTPLRPAGEAIRIWTDNYSNPLQVLY